MKGNPLAYRVNAYLAALVITVFGAGASLLIIHIAGTASAAAAAFIPAL
ncbi:MAG TPA: hypothetical protein VHC68_03065 [Candidatus Paceibacterota bacterium]|nr:hypothetical protein [Candidatus Paceibacterota bacterium]